MVSVTKHQFRPIPIHINGYSQVTAQNADSNSWRRMAPKPLPSNSCSQASKVIFNKFTREHFRSFPTSHKNARLIIHHASAFSTKPTQYIQKSTDYDSSTSQISSGSPSLVSISSEESYSSYESIISNEISCSTDEPLNRWKTANAQLNQEANIQYSATNNGKSFNYFPAKKCIDEKQELRSNNEWHPEDRFIKSPSATSIQYQNTTPAASCIPCTPRKNKPQNFRDNPQKSTRIKTELCATFMSGKICSFGTKCSYAHGEHELQLTSLLERHEAGVIDIETYRTRPCLDFVATGACPFNERCSCVHDPRIKSGEKAWLPHCELQVHNLNTNVNVDCKYHQRFASMHYGNPFGFNNISGSKQDIQKEDHEAWKICYERVCNQDSSSSQSPQYAGNTASKLSQKSHAQPLSEAQRLEIVLKMRGTFDDQDRFNYSPTNIIFNELCTIVQTRAFNIIERERIETAVGNEMPINRDHSEFNNELVKEIPLADFNDSNKDHIIVREIAFGPLMEKDTRPVALWFGILENDVQVCTAKQAKRPERTKRQLSNKRRELQEQLSYAMAVSKSTKSEQDKEASYIRSPPSSFAKENFGLDEPFYLVSSEDRDAFNLATEILRHRLDVVKLHNSRASALKVRTAIAIIKTRELCLKMKFFSMKRNWTNFIWPINKGREVVTKETQVPPAAAFYFVPNDYPDIHNIWQSFISVLSGDISKMSGNLPQSRIKRRLKTFQVLSRGLPICANRKLLPGILSGKQRALRRIHLADDKRRMKERCWKDILLYSDQDPSDWDMVKDHYLYRRKDSF